jgi:glucokinase
MGKRYILGVDLGATNIKLGLLDRDRIILKQILPTKEFPSKEELLSGLSHNLLRLLAKRRVSRRDVLGLGIGAPGPIDSRRGIVHYFPNIKGWRNVPLKQIMQKKTGLPVFVDNDANLMCLAETRVGAARGKRNVVALTLGSGVGGGIVIEGRLYRGASLSAGEIGHIPLSESGPRCNCGGIACLERYIGNRYILEKAVAVFGRDISLEKLTLSAKQGNLKALAIWQEMAEHLGVCLSGVINFLNPEAVVIGGGLSGAGRLILDTVRKVIKMRAMPPQAKAVKILKAKLGNNAGILGAALLVKEGYA